MTAEAGVMNSIGVALAADSAVTIGSKTYPSADKLFKLVEEPPVGIMIYDSGDFLGVDWEPIIADYRKRADRSSLTTLEKYANSFLRHLQTYKSQYCGDADQAALVRFVTSKFCVHTYKQFEQLKLKKEFNQKNELTDEDIKRAFGDFIGDFIEGELNYTLATPYLKGTSKKIANCIENKYQDIIKVECKKSLRELAVSTGTIENLLKLMMKLLVHERLFDFVPCRYGLILAGFGTKEHFPSFVHLRLGGVIAGHLLYSKDIVTINENARAFIGPFAQGEMVYTYMTGIHPTLREIAEAKTIKGMEREWRDCLKSYSGTVFEMVEHLPKSELGSVAEFLVNLTKFKLHVSNQPETVGGPIDVAVITRADGFVWIKRKHYFESALNPQYFSRRTKVRELTNGQKNEDVHQYRRTSGKVFPIL